MPARGSGCNVGGVEGGVLACGDGCAVGGAEDGVPPPGDGCAVEGAEGGVPARRDGCAVRGVEGGVLARRDGCTGASPRREEAVAGGEASFPVALFLFPDLVEDPPVEVAGGGNSTLSSSAGGASLGRTRPDNCRGVAVRGVALSFPLRLAARFRLAAGQSRTTWPRSPHLKHPSFTGLRVRLG